MPSVQVKDFPQDLYDELKAYAELNHRSMAQQLVVAAEQMLRRANGHPDYADPAAIAAEEEEQARLARIAKRKALFARIDASIEAAKARGTWVEGGRDAVEVVREGRMERSRRQSELLGLPFDEEAEA